MAVMSDMRASGAKRTRARGGAPAPRLRLAGGVVLRDAVWKLEVWYFVSTAPITPACNNSASAHRPADQASVRGDSLEKNAVMLAPSLTDADGFRGGSASMAANSFCIARADGAPRLSLR